MEKPPAGGLAPRGAHRLDVDPVRAVGGDVDAEDVFAGIGAGVVGKPAPVADARVGGRRKIQVG